MHGAWVRFATDGDPGWEPWGPHHPVQVYGDGVPHVVHGLRDRELSLWTAAPEAERTLRTRQSPELRAVVRRLRRSGALRRT